MGLLKIPKVDEHYFYVLDASMLQMFGDESYTIFSKVARARQMHFLAYSNAHHFTEYVLAESGDELDPQTVNDKSSIMMQLSYVRRCVFGPVLGALQMGFTDDFVDTALNTDESTAGPYRDSISKTIGGKMCEITVDPKYAQNIDYDENRGDLDFEELERKNLKRMFAVCALYAERHDLEIVCGHTPDQVMEHLAKQYSNRSVIMDDFMRFKP